MSSILRALKKLENDPRHLEENPPLDSQFVPLADTGTQNTAVRLLIQVIGGGIVCGIVILAGWWFFAANMKTPADVPQETATQNLPQTEIVPAGPKHSETPESAAVSHEPAKPAVAPVPPPQTTAHIPGSTPVKTPQPPGPEIAPKALMTVDGPEVGSTTSQMAAVPSQEIKQQASAEEAAAVARVPAVSVQVEEVEIPVLNDPEMKLQAITWSKDPQKRIAVINNRILRQGEAVDGFRVDIINQDDVVLSDAGEQWKLLFRIK